MDTIDLHTPRLWIRSLRPEDVEPLARLWSDPRVTQFMGGPRDYDRLLENLAADAAADPPPFDLWPVIERASGRLIGHCGVLDKEVDGVMEYELVYVLDPSVWGRGYASEAAAALRDDAFDRLGLARIISLIEPENDASARVAIRTGLRLEKETLRPGGRRMLVYSLSCAERPGGLIELVTPRLRLVALSAEQLRQAIIDPEVLERHLGLPLSRPAFSDAVRAAITVKLEKMARVPLPLHPWYTYWLLIVKADRFGVGLVGFKGAPDDRGAVEIGYGIDPAARNRGYTTEAVVDLVKWALSSAECSLVTAETHHDNLASQHVLQKVGFTIFQRGASNIFWSIGKEQGDHA